jgi:hypothetical protein
MEELTPPMEADSIVFSESPPMVDLVDATEGCFESTIRDFIAMLKVMALSMTVSLAGFSLLAMKWNDKSGSASAYTKHEDDCSRYDNLSIMELKRELRNRKLCTTGNHGHLVDRLVNHDNGEHNASATVVDIDVSVVKRNTTVKVLQEKLRSRKLPVTGLKEDLITKVWIPARVEELNLFDRSELCKLLKNNKLSQHGKSKDELIRRLIEAGH